MSTQPAAGRALEFETDLELIVEVMRIRDQPQRARLPRHRHDLSREQVLTAQRARIIVATAEVVTEVGYDAAAVRAIIERAGVSSKTFYALYADKASAFFAAFTLLDGIVVEAVRAPLSIDEPREAMRAGVRIFLQTLTQWPLFTRMHAVEARAAGARVLERRTLVFGEFVRAISAAFERAHEVDPRIAVPSEGVVMALVGGIGELVLQRIVADGVSALPGLEPTIVELIERISYSDVPEN